MTSVLSEAQGLLDSPFCGCDLVVVLLLLRAMYSTLFLKIKMVQLNVFRLGYYGYHFKGFHKLDYWTHIKALHCDNVIDYLHAFYEIISF